jgi:hypothetical protein
MKKTVMMLMVLAMVLAVRSQFVWAATPSNASSRSGRGGRGADVIVSEMAEHSEEADSTVGGEVHITVDGGEKRYDGTPVTASVSSTGLPAGYSLSYNLTGASRTEVGEQDINIHDLRVLDADGNDVTGQFALNVDLGTIRIWDDPAPTSPEVTEPETQPETQPATEPETTPEIQPTTEPETQPVTEPETVTETTPAETIPETLSQDNPDGPVFDDRHNRSSGSGGSDDSDDPTPSTQPSFHTPDFVEPLPLPDPDPDPVPPTTEEETHEVHHMPKMGDASYQEAVAARSIAAALLGIAGLAGIMALLWGRRFFR